MTTLVPSFSDGSSFLQVLSRIVQQVRHTDTGGLPEALSC